MHMFSLCTSISRISCWKHGIYSMQDVDGCSMIHQHPLQDATNNSMKQRHARMSPFRTASLSGLPIGLLGLRSVLALLLSGKLLVPCMLHALCLSCNLSFTVIFVLLLLFELEMYFQYECKCKYTYGMVQEHVHI